MKKNSKIVVTGSSGVIGTALLNVLDVDGYENVVPLCSSSLDLRDENATETFFKNCKADYVFHLAARVYGIMGNIENPAIAYVENTKINTNVIDSAVRNGAKKIIAMGSTAIYSDLVSLPMKESEIWLGEPHGSEAPYAHSKRGMYAHLEACRVNYGTEYAFCVSTNLYGPNDKFDENWGHVIPSLISKFQRCCNSGEDISIWGDGSPSRDFMFSLDAASALVKIAKTLTGAVNVATGKSCSISECVEILKDISGYKGKVQWDSSKPNGQQYRAYDISKLNSIGFKNEYNLYEGLKNTYEWYAENVKRARR